MANKSLWLTAYGLLALGACLAADGAPPVGIEVHSFHIPSEEAPAAVRDFGLQSGVPISAELEDLQGKRFNAVAGDWSVDAALRQLIAGTGLSYTYDGGRRTVSLIAAPHLTAPPPQTVAATKAVRSVRNEESPLIEEIVVTAQRREERGQDVPISAQVLQGHDLTQQNLNSLNDVSEVEPSVHVGSNSRSANLYIRGIGSGESQTFDQSVGVFSDDIYHGRARMSGVTFFDLERIEILKGPQTTFFGNNAIAGAFNIVTRKPTDQFDAWSRGLFGEHGDYATEGAVGGPVGDLLAVRGAATFNGTSGWLHDATIGRKIPGNRNLAGRLTLVLTPTETLDVVLKTEGSRSRTVGGLAYQDADCPPPAPFVAAGFCRAALGAGVPIGLSNNAVAQNAQDIDLNTAEYVLTVNYQLGRNVFTSVSGYYDYSYHSNLDTDGTPLSLLSVAAPERYHQFSQEIRIASPGEQRIEYLGGIYFHIDQLNFAHDTNYSFLTSSLKVAPHFAPLLPYLPLGQEINFTQPEKTYSAFGSLTWNVKEHWKLGAGLRASSVKKNYGWDLFYGQAAQAYGDITLLPDPAAGLARVFATAAALGVPDTLSGSRKDNALMPSARIQYSVNHDAMAYFTYSRGSKAGGFNGSDTTGVAANLPFTPEHDNAYELGFKSEWLDRRVLVNFDVFRSDYSDLQVTTNVASPTGAILSLVRNAASSRTEGGEIEARWSVTQNLFLSTDLTYDHARYLNYSSVTPTQLQQLEGFKSQDLSGLPTEFAPDWSGSLSGTYTIHLPGNYQLTTYLDSIISSSYFLTGNDDPGIRQGGYVRLDARISLDTPDKQWSLDFIGKNLTDRNIQTFGIVWPTSPGSVWLQKEETRNLAAQIRFRW